MALVYENILDKFALQSAYIIGAPEPRKWAAWVRQWAKDFGEQHPPTLVEIDVLADAFGLPGNSDLTRWEDDGGAIKA